VLILRASFLQLKDGFVLGAAADFVLVKKFAPVTLLNI